MSVQTNEQIAKTLWFTPGIHHWGLPYIWEGPYGVAKSHLIEKWTRECGLWNFTMVAPWLEPTDLAGMHCLRQMEITAPDGTKQQTITVNDRAVDMWVVELIKRRHCNIFIDEVYDVQSSSVQHSLRQFINDSRVGHVKLPKECRFTLAGNPPEFNPAALPFDVGFANRLGFGEWSKPTAKDFQMHHLSQVTADAIYRHEDFAIDHSIAAKAEAAVLAAWPDVYSREVGLVTTLLLRNDAELHRQPEIDKQEANRGWASHRSWENAMRVRAGCRHFGLNKSIEQKLVEGFVGPGATTWIYAQERMLNLPDADEVLATGDFDHDPRRIDRTLVVFNQCAAKINATKDKQDRYKKLAVLWKILLKEGKTAKGDKVPPLMDTDADVCVPPVYTITNCVFKLPSGEERKMGIDMMNPDAVKVLAKMDGAMKAAGLDYKKGAAPAMASYFTGFAEK